MCPGTSFAVLFAISAVPTVEPMADASLETTLKPCAFA